MNPQTEKWSQGLREFIASRRSKIPLRPRSELNDYEEWQCRIIGGSLISWLREHGPNFIRERAVLSDWEGWDKNPIVVFSSDEPGLVAANEILRGDSSAVLWLYRDELKDWYALQADDKYVHHVHTWSCFATLDEAMLSKARKKHPISNGESYWLHDEGTICGPNFGRGGSHLWKWNGEKPELLEEVIDQWVS